jgi:hypothetical protein
MSNKKQTKALFRCVLAYSDGRLVRTFDLEEDLARHDRSLKAIAHDGTAMTVAIAKSAENPYDDLYSDAPKPESFAAAYEMFINDGDLCADDIEWVRLNQA